MNSIALEVKNLVKTFDLDGATIYAVDNVSFLLKLGEFVALVGPSGSGKTTMLSTLPCRESTLKQRPNTACTRLVGLGAFSSSFRNLELVPAKWRCLVPPTTG